jgi:peptide/nickel transport system permease protein
MNEDLLIAEESALVPEELREGPWAEAWRQLRHNRLATAGLVIFLMFFLVAITGRLLTTGDNPVLNPATVRLPEKLRPPLSKPRLEILQPQEVPPLGVYLLGTDDLGRDVFSRMMQGAWVSLTVGFVAVGIAVAIGVALGGLAGYFGQSAIRLGHILLTLFLIAAAVEYGQGQNVPMSFLLVMAVIMMLLTNFRDRKRRALPLICLRLFTLDVLVVGLIDIMLCFPSFFLILTVVALRPPSIYNIMAVIGFTSWMGAARFVRAEFLSLREQDFVTAVRALGVSDFRIIFRHMVPNALGPVLVSATIGIAGAILTESALSFLGFGVPPPHATWGNILASGRQFIFDAPWLTLIPGVAILIVVLAFNLVGEGLREILNPKLRERIP